jgi:hypothetical protein
MSARDLASWFANGLADGTLTRLPRFKAGADPLEVRASLQAYYLLHDAAIAERSAMAARHAPLRERIAAASVQRDIEMAIAAARSWLARVARVGGHGFDPECA